MLKHLGLSPKTGESHFSSPGLLFFMCKTRMVITMAQIPGEIYGQMNMSNPSRNNVCSQVMYTNPLVGSGLGPSEERPGAVGCVWG